MMTSSLNPSADSWFPGQNEIYQSRTEAILKSDVAEGQTPNWPNTNTKISRGDIIKYENKLGKVLYGCWIEKTPYIKYDDMHYMVPHISDQDNNYWMEYDICVKYPDGTGDYLPPSCVELLMPKLHSSNQFIWSIASNMNIPYSALMNLISLSRT